MALPADTSRERTVTHSSFFMFVSLLVVIITIGYEDDSELLAFRVIKLSDLNADIAFNNPTLSEDSLSVDFFLTWLAFIGRFRTHKY